MGWELPRAGWRPSTPSQGRRRIAGVTMPDGVVFPLLLCGVVPPLMILLLAASQKGLEGGAEMELQLPLGGGRLSSSPSQRGWRMVVVVSLTMMPLRSAFQTSLGGSEEK